MPSPMPLPTSHSVMRRFASGTSSPSSEISSLAEPTTTPSPVYGPVKSSGSPSAGSTVRTTGSPNASANAKSRSSPPGTAMIAPVP